MSPLRSRRIWLVCPLLCVLAAYTAVSEARGLSHSGRQSAAVDLDVEDASEDRVDDRRDRGVGSDSDSDDLEEDSRRQPRSARTLARRARHEDDLGEADDGEDALLEVSSHRSEATVKRRRKDSLVAGQPGWPVEKEPSQFEKYMKKFHTCPEFHKYSVAMAGLSIVTLVLGVLNFSGGGEGNAAQASLQCQVVSDRKVAILAEPDIAAPTVDYIQVSESFTAVGRVILGDGRVFYRLADKRGWVPRCSRKDESKAVIVVDQIDEEPSPNPGVFPCLRRRLTNA